jgi:surface polysaccharide O-acyltransferase-like enzyme
MAVAKVSVVGAVTMPAIGEQADAADTFRRYHALDGLRAGMMLLGLVLHSAVSYIIEPLPIDVWPYKDTQTHVSLDMLTFFIHLYRMPVFFVVAGFFAALLWQRDGVRGFLANRALRVGVPLMVFWLLTYPVATAAVLYAQGQLTGSVDWTPMTSGAFLTTGSFMHLWFLYHLLVFYVVTAGVLPLLARVPESWHRVVDELFGRVATTIGGAPR